MAVEALKKLEEGLSCSICLDTYTDPKLLQCNHVYCRQCLVPLVDRDQLGKLGIACPTCRQVTPVPDSGVRGLQSAFHIKHFLDVQASFQKLENPAAILDEALRGVQASVSTGPGSVSTGPASMSTVPVCLEHHEEELKLYCETCAELVCLQCIMKYGKHHDHDWAVLKKAFERYRDEMASASEPMDEQVKSLEIALVQIDTQCAEISDQRAAIKDDIRVTFKQLQELLSAREAELIDQLDDTAQGKLKGLAAQRTEIETTLAQLKHCLHAIKDSFVGKELDALMIKKRRLQEVNALSTPLRPEALIPNTGADMAFSIPEDITDMCMSYGQILAVGLPDPSKCCITSKGIEGAVVGGSSTATLQAVNFEGEPCKGLVRSLECELVSEITGTRASCNVERRGQSQYEISYQPAVKGNHLLHIKAEGQHIRGSPFGMAVKSPVENLGSPILAIGEVEGPWGVAINQTGDIVITEGNKNCVSVFGRSGKKVLSFGKFGSRRGEFVGPHGVAVNGWGNILVADSTNHRIQKFSAEGQFLKAVGTKGSGPLQFLYPTDVACSSSKVYVVDNINHRVQILNSDLTYSNTIGRKGSGKGHFNEPWGVACDSTGRVYVTDRANHRIQVFSAEGKFLTMFGKRGQSLGSLDGPNYVAVDDDDMVYVSERSNHRVSVFTSEGQYVTSFGGKVGSGPGELSHPHGVAVDGSGVVCVCDHGHLILF